MCDCSVVEGRKVLLTGAWGNQHVTGREFYFNTPQPAVLHRLQLIPLACGSW